jgi:hypothetical protein
VFPRTGAGNVNKLLEGLFDPLETAFTRQADSTIQAARPGVQGASADPLPVIWGPGDLLLWNHTAGKWEQRSGSTVHRGQQVSTDREPIFYRGSRDSYRSNQSSTSRKSSGTREDHDGVASRGRRDFPSVVTGCVTGDVVGAASQSQPGRPHRHE